MEGKLKEKLLLIFAFVFWCAFVYFLNYAFAYTRCYYSEIFFIVIIGIFLGMLVFGDAKSRIIALTIMILALIVSIIGSLVSYQGIAPELAKKAVACEK